MNESEVNALLAAHDALVKACMDSILSFDAFVLAYNGFPQSYALDGHEVQTPEERGVLAMFRRRIAFHSRVAGVSSGVCSVGDDANPLYGVAGRFLPAVGLMRIRELVARYPEFEAAPEVRD